MKSEKKGVAYGHKGEKVKVKTDLIWQIVEKFK